jgi:hypothetical protein
MESADPAVLAESRWGIGSGNLKLDRTITGINNVRIKYEYKK